MTAAPSLNLPPNNSLELHNIVELDTSAGYPGPLVRRIPRAVAEQLEYGTQVAAHTTLCELRFVVEHGKRLAVLLTSIEGGVLFIYRGDFLHNHVRVPAGVLYRFVLETTKNPFSALQPSAYDAAAFSPYVWRVIFDGPTVLHGLDLMGSTIRAPRSDEKPSTRWLAYGSSITHGYTPITRMQCYVAQTARRLGVDVLNLGLSGACWCEPSFVDYLASRSDWNIMTCELGVNMRYGCAPEEFARRARYLVETITTRHPGKPLVLITPFPTGEDYVREPNLATHNTRAYAATLRALATEFASRNVHCMEGPELLSEFTGLTCDLVHPSTEGHTLIAENLAARLRKMLSPTY